MLIKHMPTVLCPRCVKQGGLRMHMRLQAYPLCNPVQLRLSAKLVPVLTCRLCEWEVDGWIEGGDAVFPDPHVRGPGGNNGGNSGGNGVRL